MKKSNFDSFKKRALSNQDVRAEYDALKATFDTKRQLIAMRKKAGITQEEMARRLKTQKGNISRLEGLTSVHSPRLDTIEEYAHALGYHIQVSFVPNLSTPIKQQDFL